MRKKLDPFKPKLPTLLVFLGPTIVLLTVFLIWPIIDSFRLSFYDWSGLNVEPKPI